MSKIVSSLFGALLMLGALLAGTQVGLAQDGVLINEIHYEPSDKSAGHEYIELLNAGEEEADLSGWFFTEGVRFEFPDDTILPAGGYLLVGQNPAAIRSTFGGNLNVVGPFDGSLSNDGETITLRRADGTEADQVDYQVEFPWPLSSSGTGRSIELVNPALDNDLGGSWRSSGGTPAGPTTRQYFVDPGEIWRYRKGTSNPPANWREESFDEDGSWSSARTPIGYGDDDDATVLSDMQNSYSSVYLRKVFDIDSADDIPTALKVAAYCDDGAIVYLNGTEVGRFFVSPGNKDHDDFAESHEAAWVEEDVPNPAGLLEVGQNVLSVHALNTTLNSSDFSIDATLFIPASDEGSNGVPSPGARNLSHTENAPPQIRQVRALNETPSSGQSNAISAKVTDPDGVESVHAMYQRVAPGDYIPAHFPVPRGSLLSDATQPRPTNPAFEDPANWTTVEMFDDGRAPDQLEGDGVYTAFIPGFVNRTLVRYRVEAVDTRGAEVRAPYAGDPSLNFAYYVYDGVPDYRATTSINGSATTYPGEQLSRLPVYTLITREEDLYEARAANGSDQIPQGNEARFAENWEGTMVYEGRVYDHITYRLRGANGRYQVPPGSPGGTCGKRHWRFKFNRGNYLRARDRRGNRLPVTWKWLNTGRMFGNRIDGNWGLGDQVNDVMYNAYGIPAPLGFVFHLRVVDDTEEAPSGSQGQYNGDFWGIARAFENYDSRFFDTHDLPKGNLYKLVNQTRNGIDQRRYHAPGAVDNGSDHDNIENNLRSSQSNNWLDEHVNYDAWFRYHSIAQAIRHYDYWPSANKNATWYFEPDYTAGNGGRGRMWTLPFDTDATWGPTWNEGKDRPWDAIYSGAGKPDFQRDYRNHIREVRDLLWQREQLELVIRHVAAFYDPAEEADIDRWRNGNSSSGRQYFSSSSQRSLEGKIADMLRFAFTGGNWPGGSVGGGGRAAVLDSLADNPDRSRLPDRPVVNYVGPQDVAFDSLLFESSDFDDPQGVGTFAGIQWRVAEFTPNPGNRPLDDPLWTAERIHLEIETLFEQELSDYRERWQIPDGLCVPGKQYRVRCRHKDDTGIWSHWSLPVAFTPAVAGGHEAIEGLRVTEIMYQPIGGRDFEFIEIQNVGSRGIDLDEIEFTEGLDFDFNTAPIDVLQPGQIAVIARNVQAFSTRYDVNSMLLLGEFSGQLSNGGETIRLGVRNFPVMNFRYEDDWYPETDGLGHSLTVADPLANPTTWGLQSQWLPSSNIGGSPGVSDGGAEGLGWVRAGDANVDGIVDVSDAIALLFLLFEEGNRPLPCEGESPSEGSNPAVLDVNGDAGVDLSDCVYLLRYLFQGGPQPDGERNCSRVPGCPISCAG
ncbi:MAG: lamin tail domain-containing protein [Planctomycetota bacterium]